MFKKVVVGVDEEQQGRDAIALAKQLMSKDAELTLANVYVFRADLRVWRGYTTEYEADDVERARTVLEAAREQAGGNPEVHWRGSSSVGRGLHDLVELADADLLVVGSSREGLLGRVLLRDDTRAALDGAPCAVAVAPAGYAEHPAAIRKIGVGYDGSPESHRALAVASTLAAELGANLAALEVISSPTYLYHGKTAVDGTAIIDLVRDARQRIAGLGGVEAHATYGSPVEELALWGASQNLLVIGSRGYGPVGRLVHGSTSRGLTHSARCPLLVLTRFTHLTPAPEATADGLAGQVPAETELDA